MDVLALSRQMTESNKAISAILSGNVKSTDKRDSLVSAFYELSTKTANVLASLGRRIHFHMNSDGYPPLKTAANYWCEAAGHSTDFLELSQYVVSNPLI